jgi:putative RNA 2'-phosphotransferase
MGRQYVHLSLTEEQALDVGRRHDRNPVLVKILSEKAHLEGVKFWKASDTIYLSLEISPEYIDIEEQWGRKKKKTEKKLM